MSNNWTCPVSGFLSTSGYANSGGLVGFMNAKDNVSSIDDVTVEADRDGNGSYETTEHVELFTANATGQGEETTVYDLSGNLAYDGVCAAPFGTSFFVSIWFGEKPLKLGVLAGDSWHSGGIGLLGAFGAALGGAGRLVTSPTGN